MSLSRAESETILSPFLDELWDCVTVAIERYRNLPSEYSSVFSKRTRSSAIADLMYHQAQSGLASRPDVRFQTLRGQRFIMVGDAFKMRLKKLDENHRPHNIPTQQVLDFLHQVQPQLPGFAEPLTNLFVGYRWNLLETAARGVYVVCPNGDWNAWVLEIQPRTASVSTPVAQPQPTLDKPGRRVVPKVDAEQQEQTRRGG